MALSATNIQPWINNLTAAMGSTNQKQIDALNTGYQQAKNSENATFGNSYKIAEQTLNQIPSNYNGLRNSADITKNQALSWLPKGLADNGAATDSGANYQARTGIGNSYQNTMNSIGQEQNKAQQQQQNAIDTLRTTHQSNLAKLGSDYQSNLANTLANQRQTIVSGALSAYNEDQNRAEQAREANATLAEREQEATLSHSNSSGSSGSVSKYQSFVNGLGKYTATSSYSGNGKTAKVTLVTNPAGLLSAIKGSALLSSDEKDYLINNYPYATESGQTLAEYNQYGAPKVTAPASTYKNWEQTQDMGGYSFLK